MKAKETKSKTGKGTGAVVVEGCSLSSTDIY